MIIMPEGILYEISVSEGIMDAIHGRSQRIREIYLPDHDITFNMANDTLNAFRDSRYKPSTSKGFIDPNPVMVANIEVPDEIVVGLKMMLGEERSLKDKIGMLFAGLAAAHPKSNP